MKNSDSYTSGAPNGKRQLNVVFHGLWAWEAQPGKILAHTPIEPNHEIVVGDFTAQTPIPEGTQCELGGVDSGQKNMFVAQQNLLVSNKPIANVTKRHCVVELPLARDIRSVRRVHVSTKQPFSGRDGQNLHPDEVTMVQVFIYDVDHLDSVTLAPLMPALRINPGNQSANLHFFAQPPGGHHHSVDDVKQAYRKMAEMFGLDITPEEPLFVNATEDPDIAGLTTADLEFLDEGAAPDPAPHPHGRTGPPVFLLPHLLGASGVNCDGLVVDNTGGGNYQYQATISSMMSQETQKV